MKKVLIIIPHYFPGFKFGGPQQSVKNIVDTFGEDVAFYIYTQNTDYGSNEQYEGMDTGKWINTGNSSVMYMPKKKFYEKKLVELYKEFETIYTCGLFEKSTIVLLTIHRMLKNKCKNVFVAPMGVFSDGAINSKAMKKKVFLTAFNIMGFFKNIIWSFTSDLELVDVRKHIFEKYLSNYIIAEDLPRKINFEERLQNYKLTPANGDRTVRIIFLSRICAQKNLDYCLDVLNYDFSRKIIFDIYGTKEDKDYWDVCLKKIENLPTNVVANYKGTVQPEEVISVFEKYDIFLFPTKGENFGHVIYEALVGGCIPIISNTTPWLELEKNNCGRVCNLNDIDMFRNTIENYLSKNTDQLMEEKNNAIRYAKKKYEYSVKNSGYRKIWEKV